MSLLRVALVALAALAIGGAPAGAAEVAHVHYGSRIAVLVASPDGGAWVLVERGGGANAIGRASADDRFRTTAVDEELDGAAIGPDGQAWFGGLERTIFRAGNDGMTLERLRRGLRLAVREPARITVFALYGNQSHSYTSDIRSARGGARRYRLSASWLRRIARELAAGRKPLLDITYTATDDDGNTTDSLPRAYRVTR